MYLRRAGIATFGALARAAAAPGKVKKISDPLPPRTFASSSTGWPANTDYVQPGTLASVAPWTYHHRKQEQQPFPWPTSGTTQQPLLCSTVDTKEREREVNGDYHMDVAEARKIIMHVNCVALKKALNDDRRDSISYDELLDMCKEYGVATTDDELRRYACSLDEAGDVLILRENVYLHPERVAKLVAHALPFAVVSPSDPRRVEFMKLEQEKVVIDNLAHKQVRKFLWTGLLALTCQTALFFRLTFWELSWDVMEPVAFFLTTAGVIVGYTYFLITARDPSYQDFMHRLFLSKQRKLFKKMNFDFERYQLLKRQCQCVEIDDNKW
ncbi:hypothetical protein R1sor_024344 [Riccia sorocarpa]|uniref:Calcium uniporter protein C-terminal domain-containing protein n=1 Tax=Riccia sorocarpa TaxID=122646 RepID=A0ABD3GQE5_9MARC